jgi:hypothetical protein
MSERSERIIDAVPPESSGRRRAQRGGGQSERSERIDVWTEAAA